MRGHVAKRPSGTYSYWIDAGKHPARRCAECRHRVWVERDAPDTCPKCNGELGESIDERRQMTKAGFKGKRAAEAAMRDCMRVVEGGGDPFPSDLTVRQWFDRWLESPDVTKLRPRTVVRYKGLVRDYVVPALGSMKLTDVRRRHIKSVLDRAIADGQSIGSVRQIRATMSSSFARTLDAELLETNPVVGVRLSKSDRSELTVPTPAELREVLDAAKGGPWEIPVLISATTGLRRSETLGVQWSNVDLETGRITVTEGLQRSDGRLELLGVKTERSRRTVKLPTFAAVRLRQWKVQQAERRLSIGAWGGVNRADGTRVTDLVCDRGDGRPLDPDAFTHAAKRILTGIGLPDARLHDLRHAVATLLLEEGKDTAVASALLGHSSPAFTASVYQHVRPKLTDEASNTIGDALG